MVSRHQINTFFLLPLSIAILLMAEPVPAADLNVLILHSYHQEYLWTKKENDGFVKTLQARFAGKELAFSSEYLDTKRIPFTDEYQDFFKQYLQQKYLHRDPDIIFLTDDNAVRFFYRYREELFPEVPAIFSGVNATSLKEELADTRISGIFEVKDVKANLDLIEKLFPNVTNISVIGDNSPTYQAIYKRLHAQYDKLPANKSRSYITGSTLSQVLDEIRLKKPDIVLLASVGALQNKDGHTFSVEQSITRIRQAGSFAIICMEDAYMMEGVLGGIFTSGVEQGIAAAEMGYRLVTGGAGQKQQHQFEQGPNVPMFNYRELIRLGINFDNLPGNSHILNQPVSFYEENKEIVLTSIIAFLLLLILVSLLSWSVIRRKKAEANLLASEYFLSSVLENLPDLVFVKDASTLRFVRANKAAERYFGRRKEEIIGKSDYDFFPPDEADFFTKKDREALDAQIQVNIPLERIQTPEGRRYLSTRKIPILGNKQQSQYLLGISRDITEEINAAKRRKELEDRLQQAQKMEAIGTLAGGIAHDFNNILSSVVGFTELAQLKAEEPDEVRSLLDNTLKGAERARLLVRQILTFSRQDEQQRRPLFFADLLQDGVSLLRSTLPSTITIEEKIACRGAVMANPTQIHQIIMNLGTNGYQAMEDSAGTLTFSLDEVTSDTIGEGHLSETAGAKLVHFSIEDTGCGMNMETQERMFEPYFTTKGSTSGTGLGLAVVHGIVKSHDGQITVSSEKGIGTRIDIYLPLFEGEVDDIPETKQQDNLVGGEESLLIVDDEPDITKMMGKYLSIFGYKARVFTKSPAALAEFEKNPTKYDLVITDMTMPELTGVELAMKMLEINPELPIILCTGHSDDIDREKALSMGIGSYCEKPITIEGLLLSIRELLDR